MAFELFIKGGCIMMGAGLLSFPGGVAIKAGLIAALGRISAEARRVINKGRKKMPAWMDPVVQG